MNHEHMTAMLAMSLFAIGAVAVILYQHASATAQVVGLLGASGAQGSPQTAILGMPVSLAGTPTVGQSGSAQTPAVAPLNINPGYTLQ